MTANFNFFTNGEANAVKNAILNDIIFVEDRLLETEAGTKSPSGIARRRKLFARRAALLSAAAKITKSHDES